MAQSNDRVFNRETKPINGVKYVDIETTLSRREKYTLGVVFVSLKAWPDANLVTSFMQWCVSYSFVKHTHV